MKRLISIACLCTLPIAASIADDGPNTLASTLEIFVFPAEGQDATQQSKDEAECYSWAVDNTGTDPFELMEQTQDVTEQTAAQIDAAEDSTQGAGARGAVRGAAAGAIVGEIADEDTSDAAGVGAAVGLIHSRRSARRSSEAAQDQAEAQMAAHQEDAEHQHENFKKAFGVCLEAKDYLVK